MLGYSILLFCADLVENAGQQDELLFKVTELISGYLKEYSDRKSKVVEFKQPAELRLACEVRCGTLTQGMHSHTHVRTHTQKPSQITHIPISNCKSKQ